MNKSKLLIQTLVKFILGIVLIGILLFLPAGTLGYKNAWLLMGLLFIPMFFVGVVLFIKNPELLEKRIKNKEKEDIQKRVIDISIILFLLGFIISGLDFRFGWSNLNDIVIYIASFVLLFSYGMYIEVLRENAYLSRTIEIQENQKVISTGLYGIVRHPMYLATLLLFMSFPLVLGSLYGFIIFLGFPFVLAKRIKNEEKVLEEGLEGYIEYKQKVKFKIIPFIW